MNVFVNCNSIPKPNQDQAIIPVFSNENINDSASQSATNNGENHPSPTLLPVNDYTISQPIFQDSVAHYYHNTSYQTHSYLPSYNHLVPKQHITPCDNSPKEIDKTQPHELTITHEINTYTSKTLAPPHLNDNRNIANVSGTGAYENGYAATKDAIIPTASNNLIRDSTYHENNKHDSSSIDKETDHPIQTISIVNPHDTTTESGNDIKSNNDLTPTYNVIRNDYAPIFGIEENSCDYFMLNER